MNPADISRNFPERVHEDVDILSMVHEDVVTMLVDSTADGPLLLLLRTTSAPSHQGIHADNSTVNPFSHENSAYNNYLSDFPNLHWRFQIDPEIWRVAAFGERPTPVHVNLHSIITDWFVVLIFVAA